MQQTIQGVVEGITFRSEESGFTVFRIRVDGQDELSKLVAQSEAMPGQRIVAVGEWAKTPFGIQFKADVLTASMPITEDGLVKYLSSGIIKGVGVKVAERITKKFGMAAIDVIESTPERLNELQGVGPKTIEKVKVGWMENQATNKIMMFLHSNGVPTGQAWRIYKTYGKDAVQKIIENPYCLTDVRGIGFKSADKIAMNLGVPKESMQRARAAITYVLSEHSTKGHCGIAHAELVNKTSSTLEITVGVVEKAIAEELAVKEKPLLRHIIDGGVDYIFLARLARYEEAIAIKLKALAKSAPAWKIPKPAELEKIIDQAEHESGLKLAPHQRDAVRTAVAHRVMVLTGGPGVGKTAVLKCILAVFRLLRIRHTLAAPTGKAAKRMKESTGTDASTLHRLFKLSMGSGNDTSDAGLVTDAVVIDETSMMDVPLTFSVLDGMPEHASLIIVGDIDQLPSVGPGNVLGDLIDSGLVPVVRLTQIFRQAAGSMIIKNAHLVNSGEMPEKGHKDGDFFFLPVSDNDIYALQGRDPEMPVEPEELAKYAAEMIVDLVKRRLPAKYKFNPKRDIQVLAPMNGGVAGTHNLNIMLQQAVNPVGDNFAERAGVKYGVGDRVMQTVNNYDKEVFNGDTGFITAIDKEEKVLFVSFDGNEVEYEFNELDELVLSYCMTIHKCVHPDTIIESEQGLIKIADAANSGLVASADGVALYDKKIELPEMDALEITTERGYRIVVTKEHGMDVWNGDSYARANAEDLQVGSWLRLKNSACIEPKGLPALPEVPASDVRAKKFNIPSVMTEELAEFFGLIVADGSVYKAGFRLAKRHIEVVDRFANLAVNLFGSESKRFEINNAFAAEVNSTLISAWLTSIGGMSPHEKNVPDCVMRAPSFMHAAFLKGLFEDGSVHIENREGNAKGSIKHIEIVIKRRELAENAQLLLLRLGVVAKLRPRKFGSHHEFILRITGESIAVFEEKVGFISEAKKAKLAMRKPESRVVMPISRAAAASLSSIYKKGALRCRYQNAMAYGTISRKMAHIALESIDSQELRENLLWHHERIVSIKQTSCKAMCLHVPETHRFLQNGFSGWNSQGSQFDVVIIPLLNQHYMMLARNLLYTGITRAAKMVILVGQESAVRKAVKNNKSTQRTTRLKKLLMTT